MFRWFALAIFVAALAISTRLRWRARRVAGAIPRRDEPAGLVAGRLLVALPLFGGVVAYLVNPQWMDWAAVTVPSWVPWTGLCLGVLTVPSVYWVLATLGTNVSETVLTKSRQVLVTSGPYRWIRHPLYLVGICLFLSVGLMAANWFILVLSLVAALAVRLAVIPREEAALLAAFGDAYRGYREGTGALFPSQPADRRGAR